MESGTIVGSRVLRLSVWSLVAVVGIAAVAVWYGQRLADGQALTVYGLFPLFGLLAFSLMWTHYIAGALRRLLGVPKTAMSRYSAVTSWAVLFLILLHPGLFWWQLGQDGYGWPPISHLSVYTGEPARFALLLGTLALLAFLAFELHRKYADRRWWRWVEYANIGAMAAIWAHALILGGELSVLWYKLIWYGYGVSFVAAVLYIYRYERRKKEGNDE